MAGSFSADDARTLLRSASGLIERLNSANAQLSSLEDGLKQAVDAYKRDACERVLGSIPVRETSAGSYQVRESDGIERTLAQIQSLPSSSSCRVSEEGEMPVSVSACADRAYAKARMSAGELRDSHRASQIRAVLFAVMNRQALIEECSRLLQLAQEKVSPMEEALQVRTGMVKWLFASKGRKEEASKAYSALKVLLNGPFASSCSRLAQEVELLSSPSDAMAREWFSENEWASRQTLESIVPGFIGESAWPFSVDQALGVLTKARGIDSLIKSFEQLSAVLEEGVKSSARRYIMEGMLEELRKIPIDELNRNRRGIRIKALKDAGYQSIEDVFTATQYGLSSIRGLSEEGAREIKTEAAEMADRVRGTIKIRLSADRRTLGSDAVVRSAYALRTWNGLRSSFRRAASLVSAEVDQAESRLACATRHLSWLFASDEEVSQAAGAFRRLTVFLDSAECQRAEDLLRSASMIKSGDFSTDEAWESFCGDPVSFVNVLEEIVPDAVGSGDNLFGLPEDLAREIQDQDYFPDGLLCTLRRYQEWGVKYILHQEKALLGDEMGLGKTVQAIATMVSLRNVGEKRFIVICPASVLENWCREIARFSRLRVTKVHGRTCTSAFDEWKRVGGVAVTTYETAVKLALAQGERYGLAVVDEAHYIKNPDAARSVNVRRLLTGANRIVMMTGTAIENKVDEMLTLIGYLRPEIAASARPLAFMAGAQRFRDKIAPVYYRRKREDVLTELPELIESEEWCTLNSFERNAYEHTVLERNFMAMRRVSWNVNDLDDSSKAHRLLEIVEDACGEGRKVLVFTFFLKTAEAICGLMGDRCIGFINGSVAPARRQEIVEAFESAPAGSVLVSQVQSGGTGMNIQSASVVVFCEPQLKPSIENQAISRAYRMGQTRSVLAYRLLCVNTVDERIMELLKKKQAIFDAFADKSSAAAAAAKEDVSVGRDAINSIIEEEIERIKAENPDRAAKVEQELVDAKSRQTDSMRPGGNRPDVYQARGGWAQDNLAGDEERERMYEPRSIPIGYRTKGDVEAPKKRPPHSAGVEMSESTDAPRYCMWCGKELPSDAIYCPNCGKRVRQ